MWEANKDGRYLCWDCKRSEEISRLSFLPKGWSKLEDVDWGLIKKNYVMLAEDLLRRFREAQGDDPAYGIVFQFSQNWILDLHINTQDGIGEIPQKMREVANWAKERSDDELAAEAGIWYTEVWKYPNLGCIFETPLRAIDTFHYDLFEELGDSADDSDVVCSKVEEARMLAIQEIRNSEAFAAVLKSPECRVLVVDDDGLDYETKAHIGT
jgi:hypothetical protein